MDFFFLQHSFKSRTLSVRLSGQDLRRAVVTDKRAAKRLNAHLNKRHGKSISTAANMRQVAAKCCDPTLAEVSSLVVKVGVTPDTNDAVSLRV